MNKKIQYLLFPKRCVACDKVLDFGRYKYGFCKKCKNKITYAYEPVCKVCGKVIIDSNGELCNDCMGKKHYFLQAKGVYVYEGPIKGVMYRFKYSNRRCYKYTFARDIVRVHGKWLRGIRIDAIIPVPMYKKKQRKRGYNQAALIAEALAKEIGVVCYSKIVSRNRDTTPMKGLSDTQRQKNLKNAFNFSQKGLQLERVLLIDDIYTTGATMDSVAKVLRDAGVKEVYGLCMCVGKGYSH